MKKIVYLFLLISSASFSQSQSEKLNIYNNEGVEINVSKLDCISKSIGIEKQLFVIELINQNDYPLIISFKKELWYDNNCSNCNSESPEHIVNQKIEANSIVIGDCDNKTLTIFVKMLNLKDVRQLTNYEFKDIKIEKAK